ncbi:replicative DNA helicase [Pajaroellobacter abortibovis]|uniref:Replicative DNA helicase n=1 Tax=Pajaroellobacter abortibovis TaxID=1882918 RepID=A0A1L6MZV6_9BACT|nr:replicative DNA helicase [Pajaroellobacter abortibovis]
MVVNIPSVEGRIPPHDLEVEAAVLSAIMIDSSTLDKLLEFLKAEHFYSEAHRRIFEACVELKSVGQPVDVVQVGSWLKSRNRIQQIGGMAYLTEVLNAAPVLVNAASYAQTIYEKWRIRQLIMTCQRVAAQGYLDYGDSQSFIDQAEQAVYEIARTQRANQVEKLLDVMKRTFKQISDASARGERITGLATGFDRYDRLTAGLHQGDLTILAARPGMGKTSLALNIGVNVARPRFYEDPHTQQRWEEPGWGVLVFSLEMPREQIANRMLCSEARVNVSKLRAGGQTREDWNRLTQAAAELGRLPIWVDDTPTLSLLELRAKVRRLQAEYDKMDESGKRIQRIGLVIVDYLQLMKGRDGINSREQEISEISRGLKALAKELSLPVIALSQLNRAVETRSEKSKRPQISDLRESGAIEQDADNICFIYREDYYNKETNAVRSIAELIIAKQRNGPTGFVKVRFDREYARFDNLAEGEDMNELRG